MSKSLNVTTVGVSIPRKVLSKLEYLELIKKKKELAARPEKIEEIRLNEIRRRRIEVNGI